jgi:Ni/Co efflux regulator RcnB
MKKFIIAALAASVVATPVMAAPYQGHNDRGRVEQRHDDRGRFDNRRSQRYQSQYRGWHTGERFDRRQARNYRVISSPRNYHLREAPRGYRWVQSGNDAVLIGITSGIVASVIANMIR